jgi:heme exporter protein CcmD
MDLGAHAFYILAAYAATALIVLGLVTRAVLDHRAQRRALAALEMRGARRRSDAPAPAAAGASLRPLGSEGEAFRGGS